MEKIDISSDSEDTIILVQDENIMCDGADEIQSVINKYISHSKAQCSEDNLEEESKAGFRNFDKYNILDEFSDDDLIAEPLHQRVKANSCSLQKQFEQEALPSIFDDDDVLTSLGSLSRKYNNSMQSENSVELPHNNLTEKAKKTLEQHEAKLKKLKERQQKKEELQMQKTLKRVASESNKNLKPGECMKFIVSHIDENIINEEYGQTIVNIFQSENVTYSVQSQVFPNTISWTRKVQSHLINNDGQLALSEEQQETNEILVILNSKDLIQHVKENTLCTYVQSIKSVLHNKTISLVIYNLKSYFRHLKNTENKEFRSQISSNEEVFKKNGFPKGLPSISKRDVMYALTELQLLCSCSSRMVENTDDVALVILQFTKSVAQLPHKVLVREKQEKVNWYAQGDNRDCVKIDKNGNGLQRLWKQILAAFPLANLEYAEAIMSQYPTQSSLMEAYEKCTSKKEAELLLKDITTRRTAGPLSHGRNVGPELSKKIYNYLTAIDGDVLL